MKAAKSTVLITAFGVRRLTCTTSRRAALLTVAGLLAACAAPGAGSEWITLIDGDRGLADWNRTGDGNWRAVDGAIQIDGKTNKDAAFLYSKSSFIDFEMVVEYWADEPANSGVFFRITNTTTINTKGGYEVQIFDTNPPYPTGSLVNVKQAPPDFKAAHRWNTFVIRAKGPRLTVDMNGRRAVEADDRTFPSGPIGLQYNSGTVKFRKVMIRPL